MNKVEFVIVGVDVLDNNSIFIIVDKHGLLPSKNIDDKSNIDQILCDIFKEITDIDISWIRPRLLSVRNKDGLIVTYSALISYNDVSLKNDYVYDNIRNMTLENTNRETIDIINIVLQQRY